MGKPLYDCIAPYLARNRREYTRARRAYICYALTAAREASAIPECARAWLTSVIRERLGYGVVTVPEWLRIRGFITGDVGGVCTGNVRFACVQKYRHRWLKALCEEYEATHAPTTLEP